MTWKPPKMPPQARPPYPATAVQMAPRPQAPHLQATLARTGPPAAFQPAAQPKPVTAGVGPRPIAAHVQAATGRTEAPTPAQPRPGMAGPAAQLKPRNSPMPAQAQAKTIQRMEEEKKNPYQPEYKFGYTTSRGRPTKQLFQSLEGLGGDDDPTDFSYKGKQLRAIFNKGVYVTLFREQLVNFSGTRYLVCGLHNNSGRSQLGEQCGVDPTNGIIQLELNGAEKYDPSWGYKNRLNSR